MGLNDKAKIIGCLSGIFELDILEQIKLPEEQRKIHIEIDGEYRDHLTYHFNYLIKEEEQRRASYGSTEKIRVELALEKEQDNLKRIEANYSRMEDYKKDFEGEKIKKAMKQKKGEIKALKKELYGSVLEDFIKESLKVKGEVEIEYVDKGEHHKFTIGDLDKILNEMNGTKQS